MEKPKFNLDANPLQKLGGNEETIQWAADTSRLMKIGLRNHDPQTMSAVHDRISERMGAEFADQAITTMITHLMTTENWSFFDEAGNPFPFALVRS